MNAGGEKTRLDTCGCCGSDVPAPAIHNPPGLPSLLYRIGTHSELLRRLVARLPKWTIPDGDRAQQRPLAKLTTRSGDDPATALLDAWAVVGDVLTFYQERIANEGFLRTASERRSVLELARAIGYELDPGVAASAYLAFAVEDAQQLPDTAAIPAGTRVQSIPMSNDELPQTFETSRDFEAKVAWNKLKPRATEPQEIRRGVTELYLDGVQTSLQPGDPILLVGRRGKDYPGGERWDFRVLKTVETFPDDNCTRVTWETGLGHEGPTVEPADKPAVYAFRLRAALFGHNAPDWRAMPDSIQHAWDREERQRTQWPDFEIQTAAERIIDLDAVYPKIVVDSWIVLSKPTYVELYQVEAAAVGSRTDYTLTAKVTRLKLDSGEHLSWFPLRETVVYAESDKLKLAGRPIETAVQGKRIQLAGLVDGLQREHVIIVSGRKHANDDEEVSEVAIVASSTPGDGYTELELQEELTHKYERTTVTIYANVVHATHGETVSGEVLGGGDGARSFQTFQLKKPPLTYVSAASGSESTLSLRVEGVQWQQLPSLFAAGQTSRSYTVRINDRAEARVIFGDGRDGARLPTGQENVVATYRSGIGAVGNVGAGSLRLLQTRPFGIRGVTNPSAASGGEEPERLADARKNAPVTVLTLERIVSLQDYEDYARSFPGIGKARADKVWIGEAEAVHITIGTADGRSVETTLSDNLFDAIASRRDPLQQVRLGSFELLRFNVDASVLIDPAYEWEGVQAAIRTALQDAFSYDEREFGQPVSAAEVIRMIHATKGVVAVDLNGLALTGDDASSVTSLAVLLQAERARWEGAKTLPAQLLLIDAAGIQLKEMQP